MQVPPVGSVGAIPTGTVATPDAPPPGGFARSIAQALDGVAHQETVADAITQQVATGGNATITDLMVATTKAQLSVELLVQVRNRAVAAYQEIMRMQI